MSISLMARVWELELGRADQAVLLCLADHASDDGSRCYPSVRLIAHKTGYQVRNVQIVMRRLEGAGLLVLVGNAAGGRGKTRHYTICLEKGAKKTPFIPKDANAAPFTPERVQSATLKGAPQCTRTIIEPLYPLLPSGVAPQGAAPSQDFIDEGKADQGREPEPVAPASPKGCRLPDDWAVSDALRADVVAIGLAADQVDAEAEQFCDWWRGEDRPNAVKRDWEAAFKVWVRREMKHRGHKPRALVKGREAVAQAVAAKAGILTAPVFVELAKLLDQKAVNSWFSDARLSFNQAGQLRIELPTVFIRDWVRNHYVGLLAAAVERVGYPKAGFELAVRAKV